MRTSHDLATVTCDEDFYTRALLLPPLNLASNQLHVDASNKRVMSAIRLAIPLGSILNKQVGRVSA